MFWKVCQINLLITASEKSRVRKTELISLNFSIRPSYHSLRISLSNFKSLNSLGIFFSEFFQSKWHSSLKKEGLQAKCILFRNRCHSSSSAEEWNQNFKPLILFTSWTRSSEARRCDFFKNQNFQLNVFLINSWKLSSVKKMKKISSLENLKIWTSFSEELFVFRKNI